MIRLDDLTKEYDLPTGKAGQIVAADRLTLEIPAREVFGLVGPNGAGKTTTLKMICGLLVPTAGRVFVHGVDVEQQPEEAQRYIGYLSDFFSLYDDLKVWEYLDYFARAYKMPPSQIPARISQVIALMGLETKRDAMIAGLSRGMKQRLGIARAILHDPPVLVLDEPASGLDPKARLELKMLIRDLHRNGKTIFITSHVLSDLEEICTSIGILEKGRLVRLGTLDQVLRGGTGPQTAGASAAPPRRFRIKLVAAGFALDDWLRARPGISNVAPAAANPSALPIAAPAGGPSLEFSMHGSDADVAELLRAIIAAGAPVCGFEEVVQSLEQLYFHISSGEVM